MGLYLALFRLLENLKRLLATAWSPSPCSQAGRIAIVCVAFLMPRNGLAQRTDIVGKQPVSAPVATPSDPQQDPMYDEFMHAIEKLRVAFEEESVDKLNKSFDFGRMASHAILVAGIEIPPREIRQFESNLSRGPFKTGI